MRLGRRNSGYTRRARMIFRDHVGRSPDVPPTLDDPGYEECYRPRPRIAQLGQALTRRQSSAIARPELVGTGSDDDDDGRVRVQLPDPHRPKLRRRPPPDTLLQVTFRQVAGRLRVRQGGSHLTARTDDDDD